MKAPNSILILILLLIGIISPLAPIGCKNPNHTAFVAASATTQSVDGLIGAFDEYSQRPSNNVSLDSQRKVAKVATAYKGLVIAAQHAQEAYFNSIGGDPTKTETLRQAMLAATQAVVASASDVTRTIIEVAPALAK